jgi:hypothetical protein
VQEGPQFTGAVSEETIMKALEETTATIARAEQQRKALDQTIAAATRERALLEQLLALRRGTVVQPTRETSRGTPSDSRPNQHTDETTRLNDAVIQELRSAGRPVHISELMRLLRNRDVTIPGAGGQANVITHMRRDERIVRPSRGMYALTEWGLDDMPIMPRRRRRKRIRATASDNRSKQ